MTKPMPEQALREQIIAAAIELNCSGLSVGNSGNVSARSQRGALVTPTGVAYKNLKVADIVELNLGGTVLSGVLKPSSEWQFHCDIYRERPEVGAIVHTHSLHATALACTNREIPAFHYMVAVAGGDNIRCAKYAIFGSPELASNALVALQQRQACLLAHHGSITLADTPAQALALAEEVENLAAQYCEVLKIGGATILGTDEMKRVIKKFSGYGQQ